MMMQYMSSSPKLSIVIVNSDGAAVTFDCLETIFAHPPDCLFEVVVVDNCSREPFLDHLAARFPQVRAFSAPARQGFAKNYNQGIRAAQGQYILVLNNDTLLPEGTLDRLITWLAEHPKYGMVGPRLLGTNGQIQWVCARTLPSLAEYILTYLGLDPGLFPGTMIEAWRRMRARQRASGAVACISGACMLVRRAAIDDAGMLDEGYDFYFEDIEWCHRLQQHGWQVGYLAEALVTHLGDQSLSRVKVWAKQSEYRSALRYYRQYHGLNSQGAYLIWRLTISNTMLRGITLLLLEGLTGRQGYAREYLYLLHWSIHEGSHLSIR